MTHALTAAAAVALAAASVSHAFFLGPGPGGAIQDGPDATTTFEINFTDFSGPVFTDLAIEIDIAHTWVGDLTITIEHAGVAVTLLDRPGVPQGAFGNGADLDGVYFFADNAPNSWAPHEIASPNLGVVIDPGDYRLNNTDGSALDQFIGLDFFGLWTLTITDSATPDAGILNSWRIHFIPAPAAAAPLFMLLAATRRRR